MSSSATASTSSTSSTTPTRSTLAALATYTGHFTDDPGHLTEFVDGYHGTCGECALEIAQASTELARESFAQLSNDLVAITHEMQQHGQAGTSGATSLWALAREAERRGMKVLLEWDYSSPFTHDWHSVLLAYAGKHPIILFLDNGQALHDIETGAHDEVGLHGHFIVILDKQTDGYRTNDGDNPQVMSRYSIYSYDTLSKAAVMGLLMLDGGSSLPAPKPAPSPAPTPAPSTKLDPEETPTLAAKPSIPTGWTDDGTTLVAPNKVAVVRGFRHEVLYWPGGWEAENVPLGPEQPITTSSIEIANPAVGPGSRQDFKYRSLGWTSSRGVYMLPLGQDFVALLQQASHYAAEVKTLQGQVETLTASVKALTTENAALQAAAISPLDRAVLDAVKKNAAALAAIASALASDK